MSGRRRKKAIPDGYAAACKAYRFRAYPALPQLIFFRRNFGCARKVYNLILADNTEKHGKDEDWDGEYDQHTPAEYKGRFPYLKEADSFALLNAQLDVENAFVNHRKNPGHFGFPNFRAKHFSRKSYTTNIVRYKRKEKDTEGNEVLAETANIELSGNYLKLPKAGWLKLRMHRQIPADAAIKSVTVTEEPSGAVYVSILTERIERIRKGFYEEISEEAEAAKAKPSTPFRMLRIAGLDYSSPHFFVSSDGYAADMPHWYRLSEEKLAMEQQKLSRKNPGSKNYRKQKKRIARLHEHVAAQRRDWQEKEALKLAERYDVISVEDISPEVISDQMDAVFEDIFPDAVKVGMLSSQRVMETVASKLAEYRPEHIVIDPVMYAKNGSPLMHEDAVSALIASIVPVATVLTPNIPEAERITGMEIKTIDDMKRAGEKIVALGAKSALVKGGHYIGDASDVLFDGNDFHIYTTKRINTKNTHGTGCTLSSAIASHLALGFDLPEAIKRSKDYVTGAIENSLELG